MTIHEVMYQQVGNIVWMDTISRLRDCIHVDIHTGLSRFVSDSVGFDTWSSARNVCLPAVFRSVRDILVQNK